MFSRGQLAFALIFFISFLIGMIWAYRKDKSKNSTLFKGSYKVIIAIIVVFVLLFAVVKLKLLFLS